MKLRNSKIAVLPQLTLHNTSSIRVRAYAHKEKECFIASTASNDAFDVLKHSFSLCAYVRTRRELLLSSVASVKVPIFEFLSIIFIS